MIRVSVIYLIATCDFRFCKIGISKNVQKRLGQIQISHPEKLTLVATKAGDFSDEKKLHKDLSFWKCSGEWFLFCDDVLSNFSGNGVTEFYTAAEAIPFFDFTASYLSKEEISKKLQDRKVNMVAAKTGIPAREIKRIIAGRAIDRFSYQKALSDYLQG